MNKIKARFLGKRGEGYYGIPGRDLFLEEWERLNEKQQKLVSSGALYEMVEGLNPLKPLKKKRAVKIPD